MTKFDIHQFERDTAHLNSDGGALLIINVIGIENLKRIFKKGINK